MRLLGTIIGTLLCLTLVAGCAATTGKSAGRTVDDASITATVKTKLAAEQLGTVTKIDVDTNKGTVYLNGNVDTPAMKQRAAEVAGRVDGVRQVVNNLQVSTRR